MSKYKIRQANIRKFDGAFYPTECIGCETNIDEGDPCGSIDGDQMYCATCIKDYGDHGSIERL